MSTFTPAHFRGDPLLSSAGRHLVDRFSYGAVSYTHLTLPTTERV